jgi:undecaprenyl-diphosphatase
MPSYFVILVLAIIQGACELLPVSSSAHVIMAEKLLGLDPTSPPLTLLLVILHTGTMFAVLVYFWPAWRERVFASAQSLREFCYRVVVATVATGVVGIALLLFIEKVLLRGAAKAEVESLFGNLNLIATGLALVGVLILWSGYRAGRAPGAEVSLRSALWVGLVQGLCLPIRGFSRSGATISTGLLCGTDRARIEEFSFALAVVLTPPVLAREILRLAKADGFLSAAGGTHGVLVPCLLGLVCSFLAGFAALRLLSRVLEQGRWQWFGYYCLAAAAAVATAARLGW